MVLVVLSLAFLGTGRASIATASRLNAVLGPPAGAGAFKHPKIESGLCRLIQAPQGAGLKTVNPASGPRKLVLGSNRIVRIVIEGQNLGPSGSDAIAAEALKLEVKALGGKVETSYKLLVQAVVPISALETLAASPAVRYIRRPLVPRPATVTSEGVSKTGADILIKQTSFYGLGKNVKVCILDLGFQGYASLKGTELPSDVVVRSFRTDGDIEAGVEHGAACAEIVHDMAPQAKLYLVNFETDVDQHNAVQWIVSQGVQVISYSIGWYNAGDGKGTGPIDADVEYASANGVVWANSAGNEAINHYEGTFSDPNHNSWHNFIPADEILEFEVPAYEIVGAFLNWDDWGAWNGTDYSGSNQDYDLYLLFWNGADWEVVDSSTGAQDGSQWPVEEIYGWYADTTARWGVAVYSAHTTRNCNLELFIMGNDSTIEYDVPAGSLLEPGDSPDAVTAGATDCITDAYHYYSSRGPTHDGRIKPDFGAPSGVSTATYGYRNFYGTSASAPHVAGAFGLMLSQTPYTSSQIYMILQKRAVDLGAPGKDNLFGWGRLSLVK
jgi:hypothetical protein